MPADVPLLKRVAAVGGDAACANGAGVRLPDRTLPVRPHDRLGVALPTWRGCERLAADQVFVVGDTANSFDSRYFGPVSRRQLKGVFRELLTW
jgi:type IV secretory pathway protease TraF